MVIKNDTPANKKEISLACKLTSFHGYVPGQKVEMFLVKLGWKFAGVVQDWGSYFDEKDFIPTDWRSQIPLTLIGSRNVSSFMERSIRPHASSPGDPVCNKPACARLRCSGPDWCKCSCDHKWLKI